MGSKITKLAQGLDTPILINEKGRPNGVATLDETGRVPEAQGGLIVQGHVGDGGDAHPMATTESAGFMSAEDKSKLDEVPSGGIPAGAVMDFAMPIAPTGWLYADGRPVSRTTYANLFAAVGTIHGAGDGLTTFNLPDLRDDFIRGWDNRSDREFGSRQEDAMQGHGHNIWSGRNDNTQYHASGSRTGHLGNGFPANYDAGDDYVRDPVTDGINGTPRVASETRPRNIALYRCIKY